MKQYDKAIAVLKQALEISSLHASSEFALARALQRSGDTADAKEHFKRFSAPGEYQDWSADRAGLRRAGALLDGDAGGGAASGGTDDDPVKLVAEAMIVESQVPKAGPGAPRNSGTGGACMMDVTGSGAWTCC